MGEAHARKRAKAPSSLEPAVYGCLRPRALLTWSGSARQALASAALERGCPSTLPTTNHQTKASWADPRLCERRHSGSPGSATGWLWRRAWSRTQTPPPSSISAVRQMAHLCVIDGGSRPRRSTGSPLRSIGGERSIMSTAVRETSHLVSPEAVGCPRGAGRTPRPLLSCFASCSPSQFSGRALVPDASCRAAPAPQISSPASAEGKRGGVHSIV